MRSGSAPTAENASSSSSVMPPSGPTTMTISPRPGTGTSASGPDAASCSTTRTDALASSATTSSVVARSATVGNHERRDCLAASRAAERHLASDFSTRSPFQRAIEREADQGTITSTPTSVSISTASSPRSPFGSACTTISRGRSSGCVEISSTERSSQPLPDSATRHRAT